MNPDSSPFTPGKPVDAEFFTGRKEQVEELLAMVRAAKKRGLQVGWISGERGMGKSSLASFIGYLAERDEKAVVAHVHLGGAKGLGELARATHLQLLKDNQTRKWGKALWDKFGKNIKSVGMFGTRFEFKNETDILPARAGDFSDALSQVVRTASKNPAGKDRKVLLLTFDDINGLADNSKFAHWLKSMVDGEATSRKKNPVCLVFVGLEERLQQMAKENPSVKRIFRPLINISPWTREESNEFFRNSFGNHDVQIGQAEIQGLTMYSGGLPAVAHELGHAVWQEVEKGNREVARETVVKGAVVAADRIGVRYLESEVIHALRSEKYLSILRKIAERTLASLSVEFSREQLRSLPLTADERNNLNNFLGRMRKLGAIVLVKSGQRGVYRFPTYLHKMYFYMATWSPPMENT